MRKLIIVTSAAVALAAMFAWQHAIEPTEAGSPAPRLAETKAAAGAAGPEVAPGKVVVRFKDGVSLNAGFARSSASGGAISTVAPRSQLFVVDVPEGTTPEELAEAFRSDPLVAEAGVSHIMRAFAAPNDTNYSYQWHLHNTVGGMHAEAAWDLAPNAGQGVVVAVLDTGVAYEDYDDILVETFPQHFVQAPDLATTTFVSPWDFTNDDAHANDDNGHGSHVTGSITQDTNNSYGVAGVAYNSSIMPVKVLDLGGSGEDVDFVEAVYYAVDNGAQVISVSAGFAGTGTPDGNGIYCTEIVGLNAALEYAYANGVVVVAAAGNEDGAPVACPAAYPTVISVAASRFDGQIAPYSNGGSQLDVTAPGGDPNVDQNGDTFSDGVVQETYCYDWLTLLLSGAYDEYCDVFMSGTSMATPHVSGLAALLFGEDPTLTPDEVRAYIESTARDRGAAGWDAVYGWGVIDAGAALAATTCTDSDGDLLCDSVDSDDDNDGCTDARELGTNEEAGGRRNPLNPWDFYDIDGNKQIDLFIDIFTVASAFGDDADGVGPGEPDGYDAALDRSAAPAGMDVWDMGPPDGIIDLFIDIFGVAFQFGHDCT
ncbi:MAG: S8 family serine peptidase [Dehalococcoidia bacterium]